MRVIPFLALLAFTSVNAHLPPPVSDDLAGLPDRGVALGAGNSQVAERRASSGDLVRRIRGQFQLTVPVDGWIDQEINWYLGHPDYLERVFTRGETYLYYIVSELEKRDMPVELALLPIVESAFDPFAYSHGRAAGLWQIIPGTGRRFGLTQNWWYDGRRDVVEATRAALDYLEILVRRFDGDWLLAIAAYNSGEGNVGKAIRRNRQLGEPIDFFSLRPRLPKETRAYVPRFLALVKLVRDAEALGLALPVIDDVPVFKIEPTNGQLDLALAAELAGIPLDSLYRLNPGFNRWASAPDGPHQLVVPLAAAERFRAGLSSVPTDQRMRWLRHRIADGETLSEIAEKYATSVASIRSANKLSGNNIRAGRYLLVPAAKEPLLAYSLTADARQRAITERKRQGTRHVHIVRTGESFWTIARRYDVGVMALARWNAMAPRDTLASGRELVVWLQDDANATPVAATSVAAPAAGIDEKRKIHYTVRSGDNLSVIAARFRVRVGDLTRWNGLSRTAILRPGQRLTLYVDVSRQSS